MPEDGTVFDIPIGDVRYVKDFYPRLKPSDEVIERYRDAVDNLPPITVARGAVIVDGYHRWQAHVREEMDTIAVVDLGDLTDAEIVRESYRSNSTHGEQMSKVEKTRAAEHLYRSLPGSADERYADIAECLSLSIESAKKYASKARSDEMAEKEEAAWAMWLDCISQVDIAKKLDVTQQTVSNWIQKREQGSEICSPPESRQHFDVWQFKKGREHGRVGGRPRAARVCMSLLWPPRLLLRRYLLR